MKSGLKLLVGGVVSGLLGSVAYINAGAGDDTPALTATNASLCKFSGDSPSGVSVDCSRQAYGVQALSIAQIFADGRRR